MNTTKLLAPALLAALWLSACSKGEAPAEAPVAAAPAPAPVAAEPAPAKIEAGGYTPTADELVPGITMPADEVAKRDAELLKDTPKPVIPGEAPAAEAAPVAEAPAEAAPAAK